MECFKRHFTENFSDQCDRASVVGNNTSLPVSCASWAFLNNKNFNKRSELRVSDVNNEVSGLSHFLKNPTGCTMLPTKIRRTLGCMHKKLEVMIGCVLSIQCVA